MQNCEDDFLKIEYKNKKIEKICTQAAVSEKIYGGNMSQKIKQRIQAVATVEEMIQYRVGRCHPLKNDRYGQYAVDLVHPQRLVFEKKDDKIQIVCIIEIIDYH